MIGTNLTNGINLYFYSLRTMMIFKYEVLYDLVEGMSKINSNERDLWLNVNTQLTQGKENARNVLVNVDIESPKYNLKKLLDNPRIYDRIRTMGRLCNALEGIGDLDTLTILLEGDFHSHFSDFMLSSSCYSETTRSEEYINELIDHLRINGAGIEIISCITTELLDLFNLTEYTKWEMRDDLGMIQNTMRRITKETK